MFQERVLGDFVILRPRMAAFAEMMSRGAQGTMDTLVTSGEALSSGGRSSKHPLVFSPLI